MPDRLPELSRQRALLQEQLAQLEREIGAALPTAPPNAVPGTPGGATSAPPPASSAPQPTIPPVAGQAFAATPPAPPVAPIPPEVAAVADAIIDEYRVPPKTLHSDVKKGCFLYLFAALGLVVLAVFAFYFAYHH